MNLPVRTEHFAQLSGVNVSWDTDHPLMDAPASLRCPCCGLPLDLVAEFEALHSCAGVGSQAIASHPLVVA